MGRDIQTPPALALALEHLYAVLGAMARALQSGAARALQSATGAPERRDRSGAAAAGAPPERRDRSADADALERPNIHILMAQ